MLGSAVYSILSDDATLTAITGTKIYPVQAPQRISVPFIVYRENGTLPVDQKDGSAPIDKIQLQVDIYSNSYIQAHTIATQVRSLLDAYTGTVSGVVIRQIWFSDQDDGDFLEDMSFYGVSQIYEVRVQR